MLCNANLLRISRAYQSRVFLRGLTSSSSPSCRGNSRSCLSAPTPEALPCRIPARTSTQRRLRKASEARSIRSFSPWPCLSGPRVFEGEVAGTLTWAAPEVTQTLTGYRIYLSEDLSREVFNVAWLLAPGVLRADVRQDTYR